MSKPDIVAALHSLRPNEEWSLIGDTYSGLRWVSETEPPTEEEVANEIERLVAEWDALDYERKRADAYPDFRLYLDGIVKGDQEQIDSYIQQCLEVKALYPKPE